MKPTYWNKVTLNVTAMAVTPFLSSLKNGPSAIQPNSPMLQAVYTFWVETPLTPNTPEFIQSAQEIENQINIWAKEIAQKSLTTPDHLDVAYKLFVLMVEEYGQTSSVSVLGGGTGMVNGDTRGFRADHGRVVTEPERFADEVMSRHNDSRVDPA